MKWKNLLRVESISLEHGYLRSSCPKASFTSLKLFFFCSETCDFIFLIWSREGIEQVFVLDKMFKMMKSEDVEKTIGCINPEGSWLETHWKITYIKITFFILCYRTGPSEKRVCQKGDQGLRKES